MSYGITQCYLPLGRGDIPAFTPAEAGTRFSDPGGMQGWDDLGGWLEMVYPYDGRIRSVMYPRDTKFIEVYVS